MTATRHSWSGLFTFIGVITIAAAHALDGDARRHVAADRDHRAEDRLVVGHVGLADLRLDPVPDGVGLELPGERRHRRAVVEHGRALPDPTAGGRLADQGDLVELDGAVTGQAPDPEPEPLELGLPWSLTVESSEPQPAVRAVVSRAVRSRGPRVRRMTMGR